MTGAEAAAHRAVINAARQLILTAQNGGNTRAAREAYDQARAHKEANRG